MICALLLALANLAALSQPDKVINRSQVPAFQTGVNEVEVPVVVRDGSGRPVPGLRQGDFRLFDRRKPQLISRFTAVNAAAIDVPSEPRSTAYVLNDAYMPPNQWAAVRDATIRHIESAVGPAARAALFCTSGRIALDFTDDPVKLIESLRRLREPANAPYQPPPHPLRPSSPQDIAEYIRESKFWLESVSQVFRAFGSDSLTAVREAIRHLAPMPGQRSVVWISSDFFTSDLMYSGSYILHIDLRPYLYDIIQQAIRSRVVVNCLDSRALSPGLMPLGGTPADSVLVDLSRGTGGILFHDNNDFTEGLRRTAAPPEHSYILAFSPQDLKHDGSFHPIKVTVKTRGHADVQARVGYFAPQPSR